MIQCDLCKGTIDSRADLVELANWLQTEGVKEVCRPCYSQIDGLNSHIAQYFDDMKFRVKQRGFTKLFCRPKAARPGSEE